MQLWPRIAIIWLLCVFMLGACETAQTPSFTNRPGNAARGAMPTAEATSAVNRPAEIPLASGTRVAGVDVGGLTLSEAEAVLREELERLQRPLTLRVGQNRLVLDPSDVGLELPIQDLLAEAQSQSDPDESAQVPLELTLDEDKLREHLAEFAQEVTIPPRIQLITSTESISRSFAYVPGQTIDIDRAIRKIERHLRSPEEPRRILLDLREDTTAPPPVDFEQIEAQVLAMAEEWDGIVGFYLYDLQSGETIALNADTVFSGASVMKVPIMLQSYINIARFDEDQERWLKEMIVDSDNLSANRMLAASVSGAGTEDALVGAQAMNEMLRELGLEHTYQNMPYEASDYLINVRGFTIERGPPEEGSPPYTDADPVLRTTPAEMSRIFLLIDQCSRGEGELLERFADTLSPRRCREMLDLLAQNADDIRMRSGLPDDVRVEHKSGWVEDMHADVGIVRSPGGDFVLAVYLFRESEWLRDPVAAPVIGAFARMVYTAYNPIPIDLDQVSATTNQPVGDNGESSGEDAGADADASGEASEGGDVTPSSEGNQ